MQTNDSNSKEKLGSLNDDVTTVEFSRMLKRAGYPQISKYYWHADIPSLSTPEEMNALAIEEKRKMKWLLVIERPTEPFTSAYTEEELLVLFKDKTTIPTVTKERDNFIGSIKGKPLFYNKNKQNIYAQSLIFYLGAK